MNKKFISKKNLVIASKSKVKSTKISHKSDQLAKHRSTLDIFLKKFKSFGLSEKHCSCAAAGCSSKNAPRVLPQTNKKSVESHINSKL